MLTTFKEIQRRVQQRIQNDDTNTSDTYNDLIPKLKVWINERYERIYKSKPWNDLIATTTLTIVASQKPYALNRDIGEIIAVFDKTNGLPIQGISVAEHIRNRASSLDQTDNIQTGDPTTYYPIGIYTVKAQTGASAEKVDIVSSTSDDSSPLVVHIKGLSSSVEIEEDLGVNGTTTATSVNTYDANQKLEISLGTSDGTTPAPVGTITVDGNTSGNVLTKISKYELVTEYQWIEVSPKPKSSGTQPTWDIWYRKRFQPLVDDNDIPLLDCVNPVVYGAYADALREDGKENEAALAEQQFVAFVEELWASTQNPNAIEQFTPFNRDAALIDDFGRVILFRR